ncbi:hypothetical protein BGZ80_006928 [Entomortierella chlamydospora]|uniref:Uncharacterized protein n=1 Tax=Entomortierella chlamydospora TaxID=101097 RepID=A0A9P6T1N2_9FUNG|nr:hypothetical protein BGZ80_006928 [Entomortierella chlamydospora]
MDFVNCKIEKNSKQDSLEISLGALLSDIDMENVDTVFDVCHMLVINQIGMTSRTSALASFYRGLVPTWLTASIHKIYKTVAMRSNDQTPESDVGLKKYQEPKSSDKKKIVIKGKRNRVDHVIKT